MLHICIQTLHASDLHKFTGHITSIGCKLNHNTCTITRTFPVMMLHFWSPQCYNVEQELELRYLFVQPMHHMVALLPSSDEDSSTVKRPTIVSSQSMHFLGLLMQTIERCYKNYKRHFWCTQNKSTSEWAARGRVCNSNRCP